MRVVKRKKGNEEYFYLQHSFRKGTKVITKEKYLGKNIPRDLEEIKNSFRKELQKELYQKLEKIKDNFQKYWKSLPATVKKKELEEISIAFTYNTNAIEGSMITLEEAREIIQDHISPNRPLRDVKEAEAHSKVFLEMLGNKKNSGKVSNKKILEWHKKIFGNTKEDIAGKYRDYLVRVGSYVAPDWQDVKKLMNNLIKFIVEKNDLNPVELAAIVHYKFEKIHPFGDGNGRIGRLLMNLVLWNAEYPMLIIEYKNRKSYYRALEKGEERFVNYFIRRYLAIHGKKFN